MPRRPGRGRRWLGGGLLPAALIAACGPISPEAAARLCQQRARTAAHPTGSVWLGGDTRGQGHAGAELTISSDWLLRRDPYIVYDTCVRERSGQGPIRPLDLDPCMTRRRRNEPKRTERWSH
jgi:hypothetical protein